MLKVRDLDSRPQWVVASLLAMSTLLLRREVPAHVYLSRFRDKDKFTGVASDEPTPLWDADAMDNAMWCPESLDVTEIQRPKAFVQAA